MSGRRPRWADWAGAVNTRIRADGKWRAPRVLDAFGPAGKLGPEGLPVVSFASNDYLGLGHHPEVVAAAHAALDRWGAGTGSARLIAGGRPIHEELEVALAQWRGTERAVLFASGFATNLGVLTTFGGPDTLVVSDARNHASIIDGCRLSPARVAIARHGDAEHVDALLRAAQAERAIVVTETVFSMDGDLAPVDALVEVCARHGALLVLDEAHAVLGPAPALDGVEVMRIGTLSKALGSSGGFAAGPAALCDLLVNHARSYIFTTASTPSSAAAALRALEIVRSPEGEQLRNRLRSHIEQLRPGHPSPIIPVVIGDEHATLQAAASLLDEGFLVPAIRPPTVPAGTSRLRISPSAAHTDAQVRALSAALDQLSPTADTDPASSTDRA